MNKSFLNTRNLFYLLFIVIICFIAYFNILNNEFTYDCKTLIVSNELIKDLSNIKLFLQNDYWYPRDVSGLYRPFTIASFAFNYYLGGLKPFNYHLTDLILHILNCVLLFYIIYRYSKGNNILSFICTVIFAVHPVHTEAVTTIYGRSDILMSFFFLLSLALYLNIKGCNSKNRLLFYILSLASFLFSILSKENAIMLLPIIIISDIIFKESNEDYMGVIKKNTLFYAGFLCVIIVYFIIRIKVFGTIFIPDTILSKPLEHAPFYVKLIGVGKIFYMYVKLLVFPVKLSMDYSYSAFSFSQYLETDSFFGLYILFNIFIISIWSLWKKPLLSYSILFFLITLLPVLHIITPIATIMGERFLYLPSAGFCLFVGIFFDYYYKKKEGIWRKILIIFLVIICSLFLIKTIKRNYEWKNEYSVFEATVRTYPNASKARVNLGCYYLAGRQFDKALGNFEAAYDINPHYTEALIGLADTYMALGNFKTAIYYYQKTIESESRYGVAYNNLGLCFIQVKEYEKAIYCFEKAKEFLNDNASCDYNIAITYEMLGNKKQALVWYKKMLEEMTITSFSKDRIEEVKNKILNTKY